MFCDRHFGFVAGAVVFLEFHFGGGGVQNIFRKLGAFAWRCLLGGLGGMLPREIF